jgi:hypothetical protein
MNERRKLESLLDELPEVEPSAPLQRRVFEIPARYPKAAMPKWAAFLLGPRAAVLAVLLLSLGAVGGWATDGSDDSAAVEQDSGQWQELSELALATDLAEDF